MNLLEATKKVLNKINGAYVDSIQDTEEATLVANEILDEYLKLHSQSRELWVMKKFSMVDTTKYELKAPANVQTTEYIKYNGKKLKYISTSDFEDMLVRNRNTQGHDANGYGTEKDPEYFTSYDQVTIELNGLNLAVDAEADGSKTVCFGKVRPDVLLEDDYVFDPLPPSLFDALLSDSTASCLNRFREKSATYDREMAQRTKTRLNRDNKFDYNYLYIDDNNDGWGFE